MGQNGFFGVYGAMHSTEAVSFYHKGGGVDRPSQAYARSGF